MNLLIIDEIRGVLSLPDFGEAFRAHMRAKRDPDAYAASAGVWKLLEEGLLSIGVDVLPQVGFADHGKPYFTNCPLHFSLSHSGRLAAALISDKPCGVDLEIIRPEIAARLRDRVLSPAEQSRNLDFFAVWTKKEAAAKLSGSGMPSRPCDMDLSPCENLNILQKQIRDSLGHGYFFSAICQSQNQIVEKDR